MRRRARTVLCGGRSAMVVPTATVILKRHRMRPAVTECEQSPSTPLLGERIVFPDQSAGYRSHENLRCSKSNAIFQN